MCIDSAVKTLDYLSCKRAAAIGYRKNIGYISRFPCQAQTASVRLVVSFPDRTAHKITIVLNLQVFGLLQA